MRVSNSKVKTWRRCPNKYRYKYVMGLSPKQKAVQLERGSWIHALLQCYYEGEDWVAEHKRRTKEFNLLFEEEREELGDLPIECLRIMRSYLRHYPHDLEQFRVVDAELDEIVTLPNGLELNVIIDLIVEDKRSGLLWPWDHKTRKSFVSGESMLLDPQLTVYFWALEHMGYTPLGGVCYNELSTKAPTVPQLLKGGGLSKRKNIATDVYTYMREIKRHDLDPRDYTDVLQHIAVNEQGRFFNRVYLPKDPPMIKTMIKELNQSAQEIQAAERKNRFPRTYDAQQCKWDCEFKDLCLAELHGADISSIVKQAFETRDEKKRREARQRRKEKARRG